MKTINYFIPLIFDLSSFICFSIYFYISPHLIFDVDLIFEKLDEMTISELEKEIDRSIGFLINKERRDEEMIK